MHYVLTYSECTVLGSCHVRTGFSGRSDVEREPAWSGSCLQYSFCHPELLVSKGDYKSYLFPLYFYRIYL